MVVAHVFYYTGNSGVTRGAEYKVRVEGTEKHFSLSFHGRVQEDTFFSHSNQPFCFHHAWAQVRGGYIIWVTISIRVKYETKRFWDSTVFYPVFPQPILQCSICISYFTLEWKDPGLSILSPFTHPQLNSGFGKRDPTSQMKQSFPIRTKIINHALYMYANVNGRLKTSFY